MSSVELLLEQWGFPKNVLDVFKENDVDLQALQLLDDVQINMLILVIRPQANFKKALSNWKVSPEKSREILQREEVIDEIISKYGDAMEGLSSSLTSPTYEQSARSPQHNVFPHHQAPHHDQCLRAPATVADTYYLLLTPTQYLIFWNSTGMVMREANNTRLCWVCVHSRAISKMDLEFRNLRYTVRGRTSKAQRDVVKCVNGRFSSGTLVAIMGPSGAGKSSLLHAVSGYKSAGVSGDLLVNGQPRNERRFQKSSCYITQEDLLQPLLTVRETMDVAARLKLPRGTKSPSEEILQELGLLEHQNTKTDLLSGGQKKRLSIALELVNNPPIFFLDEPTSGLDTVTTVQCVKLLRQLARQGRTVVCTIHQPAASLLELFDQLYVLADGHCIFQGDTSAMVPYLQSVGLPCPRHHNPADFIIELTENPDNISTLCEEILNGKIYKTAKVEPSAREREPMNSMELKVCYQTDDNDHETEVMLSTETCYKLPENAASDSSSMSSQVSQTMDSTMAWMKVHKSEDSCDYATSYCEQFTILLCRMLRQISRNRQALWIQTIHHVMCGLLFGLCFFKMANDGTEMFNHLKMCVGLVIFFAYTHIMVPVLVYPQEVKLVKKEHFNRWYSLTPYYAALTISKLPVQTILTVTFCTIVYFLVGVPFTIARFVVFCAIGVVVSLVSEGMGMAIGSVFSVTNGCAIGPAAIAPFLGLACYGFDFAHRIPLVMNIVMKTSFIRCGLVAMILTVFGFNRGPLQCDDVYCHFSKPDVLLQYLDIDKSSVALEITTLLGIMFVFRSLCFIGLKWRFAT